MGTVRNQSFKSSIISYIGAAIGFINKGLIFTNVLTDKEVGLANILIMVATMYAQFSALGFGNMTLRFFPYFRNKEKAHHSFLTLSLTVPFLGFLFVTGILFLLKGPIISFYSKNSPLFVEYFYYVIPLGLATLYFVILDSYLRSLFKTVIPFLIREVIQRLMVTLSVTLYALGWVDFPTFVTIYVVLLCSATLMILAYVAYLGELKISLRVSWRMRLLFRRIMVFSSFSFLGNVSAVLIQTIDSLMLAGIAGIADVGVYTTSFFITSMILIPWRALLKISAPLVAELQKNRDHNNLIRLYKRTSLINMTIGSFLFLGLWINHGFIFSFMKPEFAQGALVLLMIGLGRLFDMVAGLNGHILVNSRRYRWDLAFGLFLVGLTIITNSIFIPIWGLDGAAFASMITLIAFNGLRLMAVQRFLKMHPFSWPMLYILLAFGLVLGLDFLIPGLSRFADAAVRTFMLLVVYGGIVIGARVSPDINQFILLIINKVRGAKSEE